MHEHHVSINLNKLHFFAVHDKNRAFHYIFGYTLVFYDTLFLKPRLLYNRERNALMNKYVLKDMMAPIFGGFLAVTSSTNVSEAVLNKMKRELIA